MELVQADTAEAVWLVIGLGLLAFTVVGLAATLRRGELGWFLACLFLGPLGAAAYFLTSRSRAAQRVH